MEEKMNPIEKALDMADFDIRIKFDYIDELLCDKNDELLEAYEELARLEVLEDYNNRLRRHGLAKQGSIGLFEEIFNLELDIKEMEQKLDIIEDMYDEVLLGLLANLE